MAELQEQTRIDQLKFYRVPLKSPKSASRGWVVCQSMHLRHEALNARGHDVSLANCNHRGPTCDMDVCYPRDAARAAEWPRRPGAFEPLRLHCDFKVTN